MGRKTAIYLAEIFLAVSLLAPEAFSDAQEEFHQTYTVEVGTEVEVENRNGNIEASISEKEIDTFISTRNGSVGKTISVSTRNGRISLKEEYRAGI